MKKATTRFRKPRRGEWVPCWYGVQNDVYTRLENPIIVRVVDTSPRMVGGVCNKTQDGWLVTVENPYCPCCQRRRLGSCDTVTLGQEWFDPTRNGEADPESLKAVILGVLYNEGVMRLSKLTQRVAEKLAEKGTEKKFIEQQSKKVVLSLINQGALLYDDDYLVRLPM